MSKKFRMAFDWAIADVTIRLSVVCLRENDVPHEFSFFSQKTDLVNFPTIATGTFSSFQLKVTSALHMKVV
jgi:hypothetical protein